MISKMKPLRHGMRPSGSLLLCSVSGAQCEFAHWRWMLTPLPNEIVATKGFT